MNDTPARVIPIEVFGQQFPIKSDLDEAYLRMLAAYVNEKVRAAAIATTSSDSLRVAVLAALNLADEMFRARELARSLPSKLSMQVEELERLADEAIEAAGRATGEAPSATPDVRSAPGGENLNTPPASPLDPPGPTV